MGSPNGQGLYFIAFPNSVLVKWTFIGGGVMQAAGVRNVKLSGFYLSILWLSGKVKVGKSPPYKFMLLKSI